MTFLEKYDDIMTAKEVAGALKLSKNFVLRLVKEGVIPGFKIGGAVRIAKCDLIKYLEERKDEIQK